MKALIITEDIVVSSKINAIASHYNVDTIIYKWFLKAMDNIEEIRPDIIILSSNEFPRLWKTLVQYVKSGIGGDDVKIYLYEETPLSEEDQKKYKELGITGCFNSISEKELNFFDKSAEKIHSDKKNAYVESQTPDKVIGSLLLSETDTGRLLSGAVNKIDSHTLFCTLDFPYNFETNTICVLTTFINNQIDDYDGAVIKTFDNQTNKLVLEI